MNSVLFVDLRKRRGDLESLFLNFPTTDSAIQANQDKIKAFIILMHSELECYFEGISTAVKDKFKSAAIALNDYSTLPIDFFVYPIKNPECNIEFHYAIRGQKIIKEYETYLAKKNNGIKQKDILSMFLPLGVEYDDIGNILLNTLNDYGEKRCKFAHTGYKKHATSILDRDTENNTSNQILLMIETLDSKIMTKNHPLVI